MILFYLEQRDTNSLKAYALYCCDGRRVYDYKSYNSQEIYAEQIGYGGALGHLGGDGNDLYVAEYRQTESMLHVACFDVKKRQFLFAGTTEDGGETFKPYVLDYKEGRNGTVLWLALMPYLALLYRQPDRRADGDRGQRSGSRRISHGSERDREGRV